MYYMLYVPNSGRSHRISLDESGLFFGPLTLGVQLQSQSLARPVQSRSSFWGEPGSCTPNSNIIMQLGQPVGCCLLSINTLICFIYSLTGAGQYGAPSPGMHIASRLSFATESCLFKPTAN